MPDYTPSQIVDMTLIFGECRGSYRQAARLYANRYPGRRHPTDKTIKRLLVRARRGNLKRVRNRTQLNDNNVRSLAVLGMIHLNPQISSREIEHQLGIPRSTALRILRTTKFHPYHITLTQAHTEHQKMNRVEF